MWGGEVKERGRRNIQALGITDDLRDFIQGQGEYKLASNDTVLFISTLHGG